MEWAFISGVVTGAVVPALFAAWAAWREYRLKRIEAPEPRDFVTPQSLFDRYSDVSRFCEHGGLAGPGAQIISDDL